MNPIQHIIYGRVERVDSNGDISITTKEIDNIVVNIRYLPYIPNQHMLSVGRRLKIFILIGSMQSSIESIEIVSEEGVVYYAPAI